MKLGLICYNFNAKNWLIWQVCGIINLVHKIIQDLTLSLSIKIYAFKDPLPLFLLLIIVIPPNLIPMKLFYNLYFFKLVKFFDKCERGISI